jgi:hypothetical protein
MDGGSGGCHPRLMSGTPPGCIPAVTRTTTDAFGFLVLKIPTANEHEFTRIEFALNDRRIGAVPAGTPEHSRAAQAPGHQRPKENHFPARPGGAADPPRRGS